MSILIASEIDYPFTVSVSRPGGSIDDNGNYQETYETIIEGMTADIQLSLKVRKLVNEDETGNSDVQVWVMYCNPPQKLCEGDRVNDGERTFFIDAVGDWGSHVECVMRKTLIP
jgi:hypothetical protein